VEVMPSCCIMPKVSKTIHTSAILPSATRQMPIAVTSMPRPSEAGNVRDAIAYEVRERINVPIIATAASASGITPQ